MRGPCRWGTLKVENALDLWLSPQGREFARHAREGTWRTRKYLAPHIRRLLGGRDLARLTQADIALMQHELQRAGMAPGSINITTHAVFLALLRDFVSIGKLRDAVRTRVKFAPQLARDRKVRIAHYTPQQRDKAIVSFEGRDRALVAFLFLTAVRRGEAAGLYRSDITWDAKPAPVVIERTRGRDGEITPCKTPRSQRTIYLSDWAYEEILPLKDGDPAAHLFLSPQGCPIDMETFATRVWHPTLRKAGLPRLPLHGTRHTWVTCALSLGLEIEEVAAQIGDTPEMVREVYDHFIRRFDPNLAVLPPRLESPPPATQIARERTVPYLRLVR